MKNALAGERLNNSAFELGGVLDPQALSVVNDNARRAKDRLRKHFYLLAKSFEYRTLEPYLETGQQAYDPIDVFEKIEKILLAASEGTGSDDEKNATNADRPYVLNADGFTTLRSVFQGELDRLADRIITRYQTRGTELESKVTGEAFSADSLAGLNGTDRKAIINLSELGNFSVNRESQRIAAINLEDIAFTVTSDGTPVANPADTLQSATVDIQIVHSGISRLVRDGQTYLFNHFRNGDPDDNPIKWVFSLDLLNGQITPHPQSFADQSLLATLLGQAGGLSIQRFSRPAARADLAVCVTDLRVQRRPGSPASTIGIDFGGMTLGYTLDYFEPSGTPDIEVIVQDENGLPLDIRPRFFFDLPSGIGDFQDEHGRRDGLGRVVRSFTQPVFHITPEAFYGNNLAQGNALPPGYAFVRWEGQAGPIGPDGIGDRTLAGNVLRVSNTTNKRLIAVYNYTGDVTPAETMDIAVNEAGSGGGVTEYIVNFSEPVVGVDISDFSAMNGDAVLPVLSVSGTDAQRRVKVRTGDATSALFTLIDDDSILDFGGNSLAGLGNDGETSITGAAGGNGPGGGPVGGSIAIDSVTEGGFVLLEVRGEIGSTFQVLYSPDLVSWTLVTTATLASPSLIVADTDNSRAASGFYRLAQ